MDYVSRNHFLCNRIRARISLLARAQSQIAGDMALFNRGGPEARAMFDECRDWYLRNLNMSVAQLREIIRTTKLAGSPDEYIVEDIMKRVKPVSEEYLQYLVSQGKITSDDMDCIIVGQYASVEDFYRDLDTSVGSFGLHGGTGPPPSVPEPTTIDDGKSKPYDDDGFLVESQGEDNDAPREPISTGSAEPIEFSQDSDGKPIVSLPSRETFSWADDVEAVVKDLALSRLRNSTISRPEAPVDAQRVSPCSIGDRETPEEDPKQEEEEEEEAKEHDKEAEDDGVAIDHVQNADDTPDSHGNPTSEKEENTSSETTQSAEATSTPQDTADPKEKPQQATIETDFNTILAGNNDLSDPVRENEILGTWLEEYKKFYFQWELIYAATLVLQKFRGDFLAARAAYKADPWCDMD
ncbi:hypothetical protein AAE478_007944 [Parahypoxylon ruwenzoriense]